MRLGIKHSRMTYLLAYLLNINYHHCYYHIKYISRLVTSSIVALCDHLLLFSFTYYIDLDRPDRHLTPPSRPMPLGWPPPSPSLVFFSLLAD